MLTYGFALWAFCVAIPLELQFLLHNSRELLLEDYPAYEITSDRVFWLTYVHQAIAFNSNAIFSMNFDCFVAGCMLQICAQIEILKYKLTRVPLVKNDLQYRAIVKCVVLHNAIIR